MIRKTLFILLLIQMIACEDSDENFSVLAEAPLQELLVQRKRLAEEKTASGRTAEALPLVKRPLTKEIYAKGVRKQPLKKIFDEGFIHDKGSIFQKHEKSHLFFTTSLTALSFLAFGGYLIALVVNTLRDKKRKLFAAYPSASTANNQVTNFLQQYFTRRPIRFRLPTVPTYNQGRRRRRSNYHTTPLSYFYKKRNSVSEDDY